MKTVGVIGAGLIGLALARELHGRGFAVEVWDAGEAGRGASWAGAGMLAAHQTTRAEMRPLVIAGAKLYPSWVAELERETATDVGHRRSGSLLVDPAAGPLPGWERLAPQQATAAEPCVNFDGAGAIWRIAGDHSVDNRALTRALLAAVRARGVAVHEHTAVREVRREGQGFAIATAAGAHLAQTVVQCAGAWAGGIAAPVAVPVRPRKGQMLCLRSVVEIRHVIEAPGVYLVPRAGGKVLVGATVEDVGFAPGVSDEEMRGLRTRAEALVPGLGGAEEVERWAGYRPCAPDELPILGETACAGYWVAGAHYRDGILLAPITAKIIADGVARGRLTQALELGAFAPGRFR